ncbi:MAG: acetylglutamate kinase [Flavobacterium sp.]|nr:acetylglutamate kinase [Flavobacterium sp.]
MKKLNIIKIGGNIIDDELQLEAFIVALAALNEPFILVHGGGKLATDLAIDLNIPQKMIDGRRVTNAQTLKIATMVYAGFINKNIVALLQKYHRNSIGLSGADANVIQAIKRNSKPIDFGLVGDVTSDSVNIVFLKQLVQLGITPVISAIMHDGNGQLLNTNADSIANAVAVSLSQSFDTQLIYCFEKNGVLYKPQDDDAVIPLLDWELFQELKSKGVISKGMLPKLENCFQALQRKVGKISIINAKNIKGYINNKTHEGTTIQ